MQYHETEPGQIRAALAQRTGLIAANEYDGEHEVTLWICLLQTLLTQCQELIKKIDVGQCPKEMFFSPITEDVVHGVSKSYIAEDNFKPNSRVKDTWSKRDNLFKVLESIRNALCHPNSVDLSHDYLQTGYTALYKDKRIDKIVFIHSQNVNRYGKLDVIDGKEQPYRLFRIEIPKDGLFDLLMDICEMLAQPLNNEWNGNYVTPLTELPRAGNY